MTEQIRRFSFLRRLRNQELESVFVGLHKHRVGVVLISDQFDLVTLLRHSYKHIAVVRVTAEQKFAVLSKANTTKMLARMYGNRLISCPRVLSEIPSGRVEVTGDFHWIDLVEIAISIKE